ncbi:DUF2281 domain-containing protein [Pantanalinema sp. GBBB05]|uniref:DUF2281 domain-containing protein n=1 Tax=Pantanalinema sp. GBBB05 TaxID=2604139 RepID=UPI001D63A423|nr:DUF2281 domain-containing protein [Pantanalinema sp. GBBB05]
MSAKDSLLQELEQMPEFLLEEILDFVQFVKAKHVSEKLGNSLLSEAALGKDWLKPEEDEAWQDL